MLRLATLLLSAACAMAVPALVPSFRGLKPQMDGRVVGGVATTISFIPWQVSIQEEGSHFCGGAIYSETIIVTAAHCLYHSTASDIKVRAGSSFWNSGGILVQVDALKIHEDYDPYTMEYDVAVMRLAMPLTFKSTIKPIPLATKAPGDNEVALTSGWGTKQADSSTIPTQVQSVNVNIISLTACASDAFGYGEDVLETMICSYTEDKDACQGDSGGPLVSGGKLVGIVSWGYGCAFRNIPGIYSDVAALREWIEAAAVSV
ncbi:trypsin beta-like [Eurosta solidaginis]|uniref:trypsin beta-like n=1 Tax=Eurosta solidaginis TaxID=178769 RepID=UPI0035308586